ncbi:MAG TPA: Gfo/Idh/MocA family oxidoreductase [Chloroflexota bacterium]|nr:Gfo/Idh/MocA family oxidoreductase [Chloroflexota bacterium]
MSNPPKLRIGVAGLGRAGASMLAAMVQHPLVQVTAAADPRPEPRDRFEMDLGGQTFASVEEMVSSPSVDVVYVATPHQFHVENVVTAARAGKHIICEKPMALTLADCDAMIEAVESQQVQMVVGHTHSHDPAIRLMRRLIAGGEYGALGMINNWVFTDFLYRPRRPEELDTSQGGGILFNQVPHQVDIARHLAGGLVRSVRAYTGVWDRRRPTEAASAVFIDFASGAAATLIYNGYDHFDTDEFTFWVGEGGQEKTPKHGQARRALDADLSSEAEAALKYSTGYGGKHPAARGRVVALSHQPHFGTLIASCERADLRPSADGVLIYADAGPDEVSLPPSSSGVPGRGDTLDELYGAVFHNRPAFHSPRWGKATLAVCLAIQQSARERREIMVEHQVPNMGEE